jgi:trehalose 6-phosphate synthase
VERHTLRNNLKQQTEDLANDFYKKNQANLEQNNKDSLKRLNVAVDKKYRLIGIAIYYSEDSLIALQSAVDPFLKKSAREIHSLISKDSSGGNFTKINRKNILQFVKVIKYNKNLTKNAVVFIMDADYINKAIRNIWLRSFVRWFIQALVVAWFTLLILRWGIFTPINKISAWIRAVRSGNMETLREHPPLGFLESLHKEINQMAQAMTEARAIAEEEAKLRTTGESVWTPERLKEEVKRLLANRSITVVSNREPYMHIHAGKEIKYIVPASGMVTALEPILKACGGLWIASGTGDADKESVNKSNKVQVPPDDPKYTLRRVWLTKEDEDYFYYGFSNEGLWPLCHIAHTRPIFRKNDWMYYKMVNYRYAKAVLSEIKNEDQPLVLVQDYHFALLPKMIKKRRPDAKVALFWHIPWPNPEAFSICPWQEEILTGMLGADLIGFHTQYHCNNFLETVNNSLESRVIWDNFSVKVADQVTYVKPFPISIAFTLKDYDQKETTRPEISEVLKKYGRKAEVMGVGVDRIDYTKGILERFLAIERFLEKYPEYQGKFLFVQIAAPSRTEIKSYADIIKAVEDETNRINGKFKARDSKPILLLKGHHSHEEILPFYKAANFCLVSSLHDGMNLVAKEFVASRNTFDGVLILSRFAGAAQELVDALIVNPYDIEETADAIKIALDMPKDEQQQRMKQMRQTLVNSNIYFWAINLIRTLASINGK